MHLSSRSRSGGTPWPITLAVMSGFKSSVASPASAIATSVPAGRAPLTAMWNGMLARVGSVEPLAATIRRPGTGPIIATLRASGEAYADRLGPAVPAVAGRRRHPPDTSRHPAPDPADPPRPPPRREVRGGAGFAAG